MICILQLCRITADADSTTWSGNPRPPRLDEEVVLWFREELWLFVSELFGGYVDRLDLAGDVQLKRPGGR